jgi:hypothetical protein
MNFEPKFNSVTYELLMEVYEYMCDGRIFIAREKLEQLLQIEVEKK